MGQASSLGAIPREVALVRIRLWDSSERSRSWSEKSQRLIMQPVFFLSASAVSLARS